VVVDLALQDVRVIVRLDRAGRRVVGSGVLAEELNVLLRGVASLVNGLGSLTSALGELLGLVLDLSVQTFEDGEDGSLECLGSLAVCGGHALGVAADVVEQTGNTAKVLVKVVALLQRVADRLEHLLVLLGVLVVHLLRCGDVILQVSTGVLPCLQTLVEELGGLAAVLIRDGLVRVGGVGKGACRQSGLVGGGRDGRRHGELCCCVLCC
jgi:hypothetical protein